MLPAFDELPVLQAIAELLATQTSAHWVQRLAPLGLVVAAVESLDQALASDLVRERAMVVDLPCADARLRAVGSPIKFSDSTPHYGAPPLLGEHSASVLGG